MISLVKLFFAAFLAAACLQAQGPVYPQRWVYISRSLTDDRHVEDIRQIAETASQHGLTAIVLAGGLDRLDLQSPAYFDRLARVKQICDRYGLEIIPEIFSVGYGSSVMAHDRNMAEGLPVEDALYVVSNGEARLASDPPVGLVNGGLEDFNGNTERGWNFHDGPGSISFVDTETFVEGRASLRFENFGPTQTGNARLMQEIPVRQHRQYRVTFWVKTEDLAPANEFRMQVLTAIDGRALAPWSPNVPATTGWRKLTWGFNSADYERVRIYAGIWAGKGGRFWLDDFRIEEVGLLNVLRRDGTPLTVRDDASDTVYEEGIDFAPIRDLSLNFRFDHDGPAIRILPGSRIQQGQRLRVSYYHGMSVNDGQVSICMSEPRLYDIWRDQARRMHELLAPSKYFLSMDEIRAGGSDYACKMRGMTMAQILGDTITRQTAILREANADAEVYIWSDMLDPNHNAHGNYYLVEGDYTGSAEYVPWDLGIVCWYYARRRPSLDFFSGRGFRTVAGAYYDGDTLDNPKGWLAALDQTPGAVGIMYTTWENKYGLLGPFGDLVSQR